MKQNQTRGYLCFTIYVYLWFDVTTLCIVRKSIIALIIPRCHRHIGLQSSRVQRRQRLADHTGDHSLRHTDRHSPDHRHDEVNPQGRVERQSTGQRRLQVSWFEQPDWPRDVTWLDSNNWLAKRRHVTHFEQPDWPKCVTWLDLSILIVQKASRDSIRQPDWLKDVTWLDSSNLISQEMHVTWILRIEIATVYDVIFSLLKES